MTYKWFKSQTTEMVKWWPLYRIFGDKENLLHKVTTALRILHNHLIFATVAMLSSCVESKAMKKSKKIASQLSLIRSLINNFKRKYVISQQSNMNNDDIMFYFNSHDAHHKHTVQGL